jgi:hypothetical protein
MERPGVLVGPGLFYAQSSDFAEFAAAHAAQQNRSI